MQRTVPGTGELLLVSRKTFRTRPADPAAGARFRVVVLYFRDLYRMGSPRSRPVGMNFMVCIYRYIYIYRHIFQNIYVYIYIYIYETTSKFVLIKYALGCSSDVGCCMKPAETMGDSQKTVRFLIAHACAFGGVA